MVGRVFVVRRWGVGFFGCVVVGRERRVLFGLGFFFGDIYFEGIGCFRFVLYCNEVVVGGGGLVRGREVVDSESLDVFCVFSSGFYFCL